MNQNKHIRLRIIIIIALLIFAVIIFALISYTIDSQKIKENDAPIFAHLYNEVNDGGTGIYFGLGYHIVKWHRITDLNDYGNENLGFICGWNIYIGYDYKNTVSHGPNEQTYNFHFE